MSNATSVITSMQSALNCASKCDCCANLQSQINTINAKLAGLKNVDENALKNSIKASLQPDITSAVAAGVAILANKLDPQIKNLINSLTDANQRIGSAEKIANAAKAEADTFARQRYASLSDLEKEVRMREYGDNLHQQGYSKAQIEKMLSDERLAASLREARAQQALQAEYRNLVQAERTRAVHAEVDVGTKAGTAIEKAADAGNKALNAANDVTGLKGLVNGFGERINAFGAAIERVEGAVGNAVKTAANAVGISNEALLATGRLAGRIVEIFNIIGTFATLIEQLTTLNILGGRIDAIEAGLEALGASVSGILGKLLGLQNRIGRNEVSISEVRAVAVDAKSTGDIAILKANSALSKARDASTTAFQAQTTADGAVRNAATANENATTAYKKANEAQGIGEQAKRIAGDALGKAGTALTTALTAIALVQAIKGLRGIPGQKGDKGDKGDTGLQGIPGKNGVTTVIQIPGIPGQKGDKGDKGEQGFPGVPGKNGKDGRDVNPADLAGLRALIVSQHAQTRANVNATTTGLFGKLQAFIAAGNTALTALVTAIATNTYVEKAMQLLTLAATLHNAAMLSNNLAQTLGTIINQCVGLILPKGINGQPINITEVLGHAIEDLVKDAIGTDNYTTITTDWAKANRIYQAGSNVFNQVSNAVGILTSGLEMIGGNIGKIGNALKIWGVVGQHAYAFMNPQPVMKGKFFDFINNASAEANTIQMMVAIPIGLAAAGGAINESTAAFAKALDQTDPLDSEGHPVRNPDGSVKHYEPSATIPDPTKTILAQEQAKANSTNIIEATIDDIFNGND